MDLRYSINCSELFPYNNKGGSKITFAIQSFRYIAQLLNNFADLESIVVIL